jgi:hypothetical protein
VAEAAKLIPRYLWGRLANLRPIKKSACIKVLRLLALTRPTFFGVSQSCHCTSLSKRTGDKIAGVTGRAAGESTSYPSQARLAVPCNSQTGGSLCGGNGDTIAYTAHYILL